MVIDTMYSIYILCHRFQIKGEDENKGSNRPHSLKPFVKQIHVYDQRLHYYLLFIFQFTRESSRFISLHHVNGLIGAIHRVRVRKFRDFNSHDPKRLNSFSQFARCFTKCCSIDFFFKKTIT